MPRGNEAGAIATANAEQYGIHANAEDLIRAQVATVDPALQKVLNTAYHEEATAEVQDNLADYEDKFDLGEGETLLAAAVHGNALVGVIETADGRTRKELTGFNDSFKPPRLSEDQARQREAALAEAQIARETAKVQQDAAERVRRAEEEADRDAAERIAQIHSEAAERVAAAEREVRDAQGDGSSTTTEESASGWPRTHDGLDQLAKDNSVDTPGDWDDKKVPEKVQFLQEKGVKPEAQED